MKFVDNWRHVAKKSWSFWLGIISAVLSAAAAAWALLGGHIDPIWFAAGTGALGALASVARLIHQTSLDEEAN